MKPFSELSFYPSHFGADYSNNLQEGKKKQYQTFICFAYLKLSWIQTLDWFKKQVLLLLINDPFLNTVYFIQKEKI